MPYEPNPDRHYFFETDVEAFAAWMELQANEEIPLEVRERIAGPRQCVGGWIFDRETEWQ
jgi:hypothetical protein